MRWACPQGVSTLQAAVCSEHPPANQVRNKLFIALRKILIHHFSQLPPWYSAAVYNTNSFTELAEGEPPPAHLRPRAYGEGSWGEQQMSPHANKMLIKKGLPQQSFLGVKGSGTKTLLQRQNKPLLRLDPQLTEQMA